MSDYEKITNIMNDMQKSKEALNNETKRLNDLIIEKKKQLEELQQTLEKTKT